MPVGTFPCRGHHLVKHERSTRPSVELLSEEIFQKGHSVSRERLHFGEKLNVWDICRKTVLQTNLIIHEPLHTWNAVFVGYVGKTFPETVFGTYHGSCTVLKVSLHNICQQNGPFWSKTWSSESLCVMVKMLWVAYIRKRFSGKFVWYSIPLADHNI